MAEGARTPTEQMIAYLRARATEIDGVEFVRIVFEMHHGQLRRARLERTDEFGDAGETRLSA